MGAMNGATLLATDFLRYIGLTLVTLLLICIGVQSGINGITERVLQAPWAHHVGAG